MPELSPNETKLSFDLRTEADKAVALAHELVRRILALEKRLKDRFPSHVNAFSPVGADEMIVRMIALLDRFQAYKMSRVSARVDIGYHFTREENMERIRMEGLLTKAERRDKNINAHENGSNYGDGIYTADGINYGVGGRFGNMGLIVIRLRANEGTTQDPRYDTFVEEESGMVVLRSSSQCVAVLAFDRYLAESRLFLAEAKQELAATVDDLVAMMTPAISI